MGRRQQCGGESEACGLCEVMVMKVVVAVDAAVIDT